jgi:glutamine amidotransferase
MKIAIIKYNAGNIRSVEFALQRAGVSAVTTGDAEELLSADKIIFPGVGEAGSAMQFLKGAGLDIVIRDLKQPVLGICLGMQLMCTYSEESNTECLGIFQQDVRRFSAQNKVPQIGWNRLADLSDPLFEGLNEGEYMYFVHGYYAGLSQNTIASAVYGSKYSSALRKDNFYGVQFHPEKSGEAGQTIIENFLKL